MKISDFEIRFYEGVLKAKPDHVDTLMILADAYTRKGFYDKGLELDQRLSLLCKDDPVIFYNLACSFALTGKKSEALDTLEEAMRLGYRDMALLLKDPDLKSLHDDIRFEALIRQFPLEH